MQELRFAAVSEDGRYAVLAVPGRSARFTLPIDERLRAVALGQTSRLAQYEIEVESPLRPKEIQARIRAGETVEEIADAAGIAVERVRWFEGPVLAERAYMAGQAQSASVRRQGDATPGPRLGEIVTERLKMFGADPEDAQWDAKKRGDGSWLVQLTFISGGRLHTADWVFDPRRRHVLPADDNAARMSLPGTGHDGAPPQPAAPAPGEATVTHLAPRLSTVPGSGTTGNGGYGTNGFGTSGRARHERPGAGRPAPAEPHVAQPQVAQPQVAQPQVTQPQVAQPQVTQQQAPEPREPQRREPEAPAVAPPPSVAPSAPPVSPAVVAAHVSRTAPGTQPRHVPEPGRAPQAPAPARHARPAQEAAPAPAAAEAAPSTPAEPAAEAGARQGGRKAARGKRSSVPSWDEIMFGNSRQRD